MNAKRLTVQCDLSPPENKEELHRHSTHPDTWAAFLLLCVHLYHFHNAYFNFKSCQDVVPFELDFFLYPFVKHIHLLSQEYQFSLNVTADFFRN